jgi:hypothetical protein
MFMTLSDIMRLIEKSRSPNDWITVKHGSGDYGFTMICKNDVFFCVNINLTRQETPPFFKLKGEIAYGSTILSWVEAPLPSLDSPPNHANILDAVQKQLSLLPQ